MTFSKYESGNTMSQSLYDPLTDALKYQYIPTLINLQFIYIYFKNTNRKPATIFSVPMMILPQDLYVWTLMNHQFGGCEPTTGWNFSILPDLIFYPSRRY